jgi:hypothetical protein
MGCSASDATPPRASRSPVRRFAGWVAELSSSCPNRSRPHRSNDWSSEDHQMAHVEPLLVRTEPKHLDAATFPGLRSLDVVYRRSEGPDLDARTDHACIIEIRRPSRIVPRFQPNGTPVPTGPVPGTIPTYSALWGTSRSARARRCIAEWSPFSARHAQPASATSATLRATVVSSNAWAEPCGAALR